MVIYFSLDLNTVQISELTELGRYTINKYLNAIRHRIYELSTFQFDLSKGQTKVYAKIRLVKLKGMDKPTFELHLKECEFRFNNGDKSLYNILLKEFRTKIA